MLRLLFAFAIALVVPPITDAAVDPADTLTVPFAARDSLGSPIDLASGDFVMVTVFDPNGAIIYTDSLVYNDAAIISYEYEDIAHHYVYAKPVATLIDTSTAHGLWTIQITVDDNTSADLSTITWSQFQIGSAGWSDAVDTLFGILDSLQSLATLSEVTDSIWSRDAVITATTIATNAIGNQHLAANAITSVELAGSAGEEIAEKVWDEDTVGHFVPGRYGYHAVTVESGGSGFTATEADSVLAWLLQARDSIDVIIDSLNNLATISEVAAAVWNEDTTNNTISGSFGEATTHPGGGSGNSPWSTAQRDSLLTAVADDHVANKVWQADTIGRSVAPGTFGQANSGGLWPTVTVIVDSVWRADTTGRTSTGSFGRSTVVGGAGADSVSLARWLWNTPHVNHQLPGTFGSYLDTDVSGIGIGAGPIGITVVAFDTIANEVVPDVHVVARNIDRSARLATGATTANGSVTFFVTPDTLHLAGAAPGYQFQPVDSLVADVARVDTVYGARFVPTAADMPGTARVFGWVIKADGRPEADAVVSAALPPGVRRAASIIVSPFPVTARTDSTGYFEIDLLWTSLIAPESVPYTITITRTDGTIVRARATVPDASVWQLVLD